MQYADFRLLRRQQRIKPVIRQTEALKKCDQAVISWSALIILQPGEGGGLADALTDLLLGPLLVFTRFFEIV